MDILIRLLHIIGSLGLFLFGMKLMSESLQRATGSRLRRLMARAGERPRSQIAAAAAVTATVQSSSATSVTIVGFANAALVDLRKAIGLLLGVNIGAAATVWIIALFGFLLHCSIISMPLVGLGFALVLLRRKRYRDLGETTIGFALMLFSLSALQTATGGVAAHTAFFNELGTYADLGYLSITLFFLIGVLLTAVLQSSAATIALTMILCQGGWLPFEAGAAMVLGENLGTTATAVLAATELNTAARRTALAHTAINLFGALWCAPLLPWIAEGFEEAFATVGCPPTEGAPIMLALFHTLFNLANIWIVAHFVPQLIRLLSRLVPHVSSNDRRHLFALESGMISTPELALMQADNEIAVHAKRMLKMFNMVRALMTTPHTEAFQHEYEHVEKYEQITDRVEREIIAYLSHIVSQDNSDQTTRRLQTMFRTISRIELIGDDNLELARTIRMKRERDLWFDRTLREDLERLFDLTEQALYQAASLLERSTPKGIQAAREVSEQVRDLTEGWRKDQLERMERGAGNGVAILFFLELTERCAKLVDAATHISLEQQREREDS